MAADPKTDDWTIYQGKTFVRVVRWETPPIVYKPITAIARSAPVSITAVGHGMRSGWYGAITDVLGMTEINSPSNAPKGADYHQVTRIDADTVEINDINAASFSPYKSGGYLRYNTPAGMAGAIGRIDVKDKVGGTILLALGSATGEIVLDDTEHVITITIPAATTALMTYTHAVYDFEVELPSGAIYILTSGEISVIPEVTTDE